VGAAAAPPHLVRAVCRWTRALARRGRAILLVMQGRLLARSAAYQDRASIVRRRLASRRRASMTVPGRARRLESRGSRWACTEALRRPGREVVRLHDWRRSLGSRYRSSFVRALTRRCNCQASGGRIQMRARSYSRPVHGCPILRWRSPLSSGVIPQRPPTLNLPG
jgi:hypothetical protein